MSLMLKIQYGHDERLVRPPPQSFYDLQNMIFTLFKLNSVIIKYSDNEGDWILMTDDIDYIAAVEMSLTENSEVLKILVEQEISQNMTSSPTSFETTKSSEEEYKSGWNSYNPEIEERIPVQIHQESQNWKEPFLNKSERENNQNIEAKVETIKEEEICSVCKIKLRKIWFVCKICNQNKFCSHCNKKHPHSTDQKGHICCSLIPKRFWKNLVNLQSEVDFGPHLSRIAILNEGNNEEILSRPGENIIKQWVIENSGDVKWAYPCYLLCKDIDIELQIEHLRPGEVQNVEIPITAPVEPGLYEYKFTVTTPWGNIRGDPLLVKIRVTPEYVSNEDIEKIIVMGFTREQAQLVLRNTTNFEDALELLLS